MMMDPPSPQDRDAPALAHGLARGLAASIEAHLHDYFAAHDGVLPAAGLYDRVLKEIEKPLLDMALTACRGNQLRTAALLGLNRNTLRKKMRDLGLLPADNKRPRRRRHQKGRTP